MITPQERTSMSSREGEVIMDWRLVIPTFVAMLLSTLRN